jgi:hypothetical protein
LRRSVSHGTSGGKDVTAIVVQHGVNSMRPSNHATCQGKFATKRETPSIGSRRQSLAVAQSG